MAFIGILLGMSASTMMQTILTTVLSRNLGGAIRIPLITSLLTATGGFDQTTGTTENFFVIFLVLALLSALGAIIGYRFKGSVIIDRENSRLKPFQNT